MRKPPVIGGFPHKGTAKLSERSRGFGKFFRVYSAVCVLFMFSTDPFIFWWSGGYNIVSLDRKYDSFPPLSHFPYSCVSGMFFLSFVDMDQEKAVFSMMYSIGWIHYGPKPYFTIPLSLLCRVAWKHWTHAHRVGEDETCLFNVCNAICLGRNMIRAHRCFPNVHFETEWLLLNPWRQIAPCYLQPQRWRRPVGTPRSPFT